MKTVLSVDQMHYLESLGLDTRDASMIFIKCPIAGQLTECQINVGQYEPGDCYTYNIQDLLRKIPYKIHNESKYFTSTYVRVISDDIICYEQERKMINRAPLVKFKFDINESMIIDAFYNMLVWCIKNNYIIVKNS